MKKSNIVTISLLTLFISSGSVLAENYLDYFNKDNIRLGAGVGLANLSTSTPAQGSFDTTMPTFMLNIGYAITPDMELGLMYFDSSKNNVSNGLNTINMKVPASTKAYIRKRWFDLDGLDSYGIDIDSDKLGAYGLVAIGAVENRLTNSAGTIIYSDSYIGLGLGAGISWKLAPKYMIDAGIVIPNLPLVGKNAGMDTFAPGVMISVNYALGGFEPGMADITSRPAPVEDPVVQAVVDTEPVVDAFIEGSAADTSSEPVVEKAPEEQLWIIIPFRSGDKSVDAKSRQVVKKIAKEFLPHSQSHTIDIRGYADAEPIGGYSESRHKPRHRFSTQEALSAARAEAVAKALVDAGIDRNIIHSEGFGATNFIEDNSTKAGRDRNRRVEVYLVSKE